jgi:hypothetical protein
MSTKKNVLPLNKYLQHNEDLTFVYKCVDTQFSSALMDIPELRLRYIFNKWTHSVTPAGIYCFAGAQSAINGPEWFRTKPILICLAFKSECIQAHHTALAGRITGNGIHHTRTFNASGLKITAFSGSYKCTSITYDELFAGILQPHTLPSIKVDDWLIGTPRDTVTYKRILPVAYLDLLSTAMPLAHTNPPMPRDMIPIVSLKDIELCEYKMNRRT